jgi:hypothetical protein
MLKITALAVLALMLANSVAMAQAPAPPPDPAPADVASPAAIVQAVYSVISGPAGATRDWNRLRSLMVPGAVFCVTGVSKAGLLRTRTVSVEDYISGSSKALAATGFYEHGVMGPTWRYAHIATVSSPYESRHAPGETPFERGINVFQLAYDGARWRIISIAWEGETAAFPLPPDADALLRGK